MWTAVNVISLLKILDSKSYLVIRNGFLGDVEYEGFLYDMPFSKFMKLEAREIIHVSTESKAHEHKIFIDLLFRKGF